MMTVRLKCLLIPPLLLVFFACAHSSKSQNEARNSLPAVVKEVKTGADQQEMVVSLLKGKRIALIVNRTSVIGDKKTHLPDTLLSQGINVVKIFSPEHGFRGDADAGEIVVSGKDQQTGIPIISLYGKNKKPTAGQLHDIDVAVFDIQDVGTRFYTYISTMTYLMEACAENGKEFVVLDRPNPCDYVDGPVLQNKYRSFVGMLPIPVLHGCTVGELAQMIKGEGWINASGSCKLTVVKAQNWKHGQPYSLSVKPSPNLPNDRSVALYPSLCLFEATDISVGRGTTFPFQVIGAPDKRYGDFSFTPRSLPGFDKSPLHKDEVCYGIDFRGKEAPKGFTLKYLLEFYSKSNMGSRFFANPHWFDLLMGNSSVRENIIKGKSEDEIREEWTKELETYKTIRYKYILYRTFSDE